MNKILLLCIFASAIVVNANGQSPALSLTQQNEDFAIFKGGLQEGHSGLYYFISKPAFEKECDSIQRTFREGSTVEDYYLKLRYLITSLNHGHTRISLPTNGNVNYKMAVLDSTKLYLPFEFIIVNKQLIIKEDCSKEQLFPKYSVVKSINNVSTKTLLDRMLQYIPADGINKTFKYYNLYNYFYFQYLFNLFYPDKQGVKVEIENSNTHFYIQLLKAREIERNYFAKNKESISKYDKQLEYKSNLPNQTAYLKVGTFYKGLIEQFGQKYEPYLDSTFADIQAKGIKNLIVDIRDNEGGGDGYENLLLSYLTKIPVVESNTYVRSSQFNLTKYAINMSDELKTYLANPSEFLENDTTFLLKKGIIGSKVFPISQNLFEGSIIVLTNGGSFSASNAVCKHLYNARLTAKNKIIFVGEENGGDIYSNTLCAGQSYIIKLPNTAIEIDMPLLCFGDLKKEYPEKRLPDFVVYGTINDLKSNKDSVLEFALKLCN